MDEHKQLNIITILKNEANLSNIIKNFILPLLIACAISSVFLYFFEITVVSGTSMENTLHDGDNLLLNKRCYSDESPSYKDIVIVKYKTKTADYIVKRVIGTSGDIIEINEDGVYLNKEKLNEPYIKEKQILFSSESRIEVPSGKVFVMGDNRNISLDSRDIGLIDESDIVGKVVLSVWPLKFIDD